MIKRYDIVVVGGGMIGLAMAAALSGQGRRIGIVEAGGAPAPVVAGEALRARVVALSRASQALLDNVGAWRQILAWRATAYRRMVVWDANGAGEIAFHASEAGEPDLGHIVENHLIERALYEICDAREDVEWLGQAAVEQLGSDDQGVVLTLRGGQVVMADLLIGADGARSRIRELAGFAVSESDYGQRAIVALVRMEESDGATAWQRFLDDGVLALLPVSGGKFSIVWSVANHRAEELLALDDAAFKRALTVASDGRLGCAVEVGERVSFPLSGMQARPHIKPRIALVGDAAHRVHPLAGQGANLGFLDVAELAGILNNATSRNPGDWLLLRRYQRARAGDNFAMQKLMEGFQHLFVNRNPALALLRGVGLNAVNAARPLKYPLMRFALGEQPGLPELARSRTS